MRQRSKQLGSMTIVFVLQNAAEETVPGTWLAGVIVCDFGQVERRAAAGDVDDEVEAGFVFEEADLGVWSSAKVVWIDIVPWG